MRVLEGLELNESRPCRHQGETAGDRQQSFLKVPQSRHAISRFTIDGFIAVSRRYLIRSQKVNARRKTSIIRFEAGFAGECLADSFCPETAYGRHSIGSIPTP